MGPGPKLDKLTLSYSLNLCCNFSKVVKIACSSVKLDTPFPRSAKQPGLKTLVKGTQFLISVPGGSETSVERTNLGIERDGLGQMCAFATGAKEELYIGT